MGFPPPPDAPDLPTQAALSASASFSPSPSGPSLCGFAIPGFDLSLAFAFRLPSLGPFDFPPSLFFALGLNCDLANPISADVGFGGGRVGTPGLDDDPEFGPG